MKNDITKLSATKLHAEIEKRRKENSRLLDSVIDAGFGNYRHTELREYAKGSSLLSKVVLVREHLAASDSYHAALDELDARRRWHGSDKPIKRTMVA